MSLISIVTICKNEKDRIQDTIKSVLSQTFNDYEFIIIDGASTDGTIDKIKRHSSRLSFFVSEPDAGIYNAMNKGVHYATGIYLYFLNAGDRLYHSRILEKIVNHGLKGELIYGNIAVKEISGEKWILKMPPNLSKSFLLQKTIPHQSTLVKKSLLDQLGKYDETYRIAADYKFSLQAIYRYGCLVQYIPECFAVFDRSGVGFLNPQLRESEKKRAQAEVFGKMNLMVFSRWQKIRKRLSIS